MFSTTHFAWYSTGRSPETPNPHFSRASNFVKKFYFLYFYFYQNTFSGPSAPKAHTILEYMKQRIVLPSFAPYVHAMYWKTEMVLCFKKILFFTHPQFAMVDKKISKKKEQVSSGSDNEEELHDGSMSSSSLDSGSDTSSSGSESTSSESSKGSSDGLSSSSESVMSDTTSDIESEEESNDSAKEVGEGEDN